MEESKEYYAFISYKREDEKWAKWLQDKLEHYKFPTNLNGRTDLPKKIYPTFRDVTDLKPGLLAEEINNALSNSQWLIVVCSPRSAKSPWVCKEAQTFIDLGRADRIIPFVIEGNPFSNDAATECYPDALLNLTGSKELLAANINEMGRDAAVVKVVARMFNLRFDTLWQRYKRALQKTRITKIISASIIFFVAVICLAYIYRQKIIINEKEKQEKISLCKRLASFSMDEQEKGNMRLASLLLLNSLIYYDDSGETIPAEIEHALNCLLYGDGNQLFNLMASFNSKGGKYCFLRNDDKLLSVDDSTFIIYDMYNGEEHIVSHNVNLSNSNTYGCDINVSAEYIVLSDFDNHVIYIYDVNSFRLVKSIEMEVGKWECAFSHNGTQLAILENRGYLSIIEIPSLYYKKLVYWGDDVDYLGKLEYLNNDRIISNANKTYDLEQNEFTNNSFEIPEFEERMCNEIFETFFSLTPNGKYTVIAYDGDFKQEYMQLGNHYRSLVVFKQEDAQLVERIVISDATGEDDYIRDY